MICPACGEELIQKNRVALFVAGAVMLSTLGLAAFWTWFWAPGIILMLAGIYLVVWSTLGKGRWCRRCKQFIVIPDDP
jgi:hypothetical protein